MALQSRLSSLPNELLTQILHQGFGSEFDITYLWFTLRNVSHRFRYLVEALVARTHLKRTYITYTFANPDPATAEEHPKVKFWLSFAELLPPASTGSSSNGSNSSNSKDIAIFRPDETINATPQDPVWLTLLEAQIGDTTMAVKASAGRSGLERQAFVRPPHMISLIRYVNDTPLCGFELCKTPSGAGTASGANGACAWEIRLDWKATISKLMLEERLRQCLSRRWIREQRARSSGLSEKPLHDLHHAMKLHLLAHRMTRDESFQVARRKRIAAQYKASGVDFAQNVQANRELALAMRRKAEEIEDHMGFINQFRF